MFQATAKTLNLLRIIFTALGIPAGGDMCRHELWARSSRLSCCNSRGLFRTYLFAFLDFEKA
jgi:hypothetical protein